jgi:hypothetical protein
MNDCLTKSKLNSILNLLFDLHKSLQSANSTNVRSESNHTLDNSAIISSLLNAITDLTTTSASTLSAGVSSATPHEVHEYEIDVVTPLIVGLFVAMILGWMLIRYKMSAHTRSHYNGSIYCCPDECFDFCAKVCKCNFKLNFTKFLAKHQKQNKKSNDEGEPGAVGVAGLSKETPQIIIRYRKLKILGPYSAIV